MKRNILSIITLLSMTAMISCSDMMDIENPRVAYEEDNRLDNANDSIYSSIGILAQLQDVADRIVIAGELRGDLMTVNPEYASTDLQQINSFEATADNKYAGRRDFYTIINNCNYAIAHMDTSIIEGISKVMLPEYAQLKTLRAYTYWQMALIFGRVNYITQPLTSTDDLDFKAESMTLDQLAATLISDLEPIADARPLDYGIVDGINTSSVFFPTKMMLGDLYLYTNQYEKAAQAYYDLISSRWLQVSLSYSSYWAGMSPRASINAGHIKSYSNEVVTRTAFDSQLRSKHSQLSRLTYSETPSLVPAEQFVNEMSTRPHFHIIDSYDKATEIGQRFNGDTRGCAEYANGHVLPDAFGPVTMPSALKRTLITKFHNNLSGSENDDDEQRPLTSLRLISPTTVYLRYAEAINRIGFHTVAYAVLKYGLTHEVLSDTLKVDSNEVKNLPPYINFNNFSQNIGTAARGLGLGVRFDKTQYVIPANADTLDYVERAILQEMSAETCFEGQRFFDLLRISHHRDAHPLFMASAVARKYPNHEVMLQKLKDINAWFFK